MNKLSPEEREAMKAMQEAIFALQKAVEASERAGLGSLPMVALANATSETSYALAVLRGEV